MAAVATGGKPGHAMAVQLTFPSVFQEAYASEHIPMRYAPDRDYEKPSVMAGTDEQSMVHLQRKRDADHMARSKVQSTRNAERRMLTSHQNYFGMPEPVLGQRKFANPAYASMDFNSARLSDASAPFHWSDAHSGNRSAHTEPEMEVEGEGLHGGVLRTAKGQGYARNLLQRRMAQLDAIDAERVKFLGLDTGMAPMEGMPAPEVAAESGAEAVRPAGEMPKIEINLLLQGVLDALAAGFTPVGEVEAPGGVEGAVPEGDVVSESTGELVEHREGVRSINAATAQNGLRALQLLFRASPSAEPEDMSQWRGMVSNIVRELEGALDPERVSSYPGSMRGIVQRMVTLKTLYVKLGEYLDKMVEGASATGAQKMYVMMPDGSQKEVNVIGPKMAGEEMSPKERLALSRNLVKALGFAKDFKSAESAAPITAAAFGRREDAARMARDYGFRDDEGRPPRPPPGGGGGAPPGDDDLPPDDFDRGARPREDDAAEGSGAARETFTHDQRQTFGYNSGSFITGNREAGAWFNEGVPSAAAVASLEDGEGPGAGAPSPVARNPLPIRAPSEGAPRLTSQFDPATEGFNVGSKPEGKKQFSFKGKTIAELRAAAAATSAAAKK